MTDAGRRDLRPHASGQRDGTGFARPSSLCLLDHGEVLSRIGTRAQTGRATRLGVRAYERGGRLRLPPRGKTYNATSATTMTAAATATTATVEAATTIRPFSPYRSQRARQNQAASGAARRHRTRPRQQLPLAATRVLTTREPPRRQTVMRLGSRLSPRSRRGV